MKNYLLISLGHNSSAIFVDNTDLKQQEIIGYEQERISGIKADSQFPRDAINEIMKHVNPDKVKNCKVLISHWFNLRSHEWPNKYITQNDIEWLRYICGPDITMCNKDFTHHDAHAYSAYEFFKYNTGLGSDAEGPITCLVVDGFGNNEEVLSLYSTDELKGIHLVHRVYGYAGSLGLMYQYATSFVGMKENQDEYKFLGYEAHIDEVLNEEQIDVLDHYVDITKDKFLKWFNEHTTQGNLPTDKIIDYDALKKLKKEWYKLFRDVLKVFNMHETSSFGSSRVIIAYLIQHICENTLVAWLNENYDIQNLIVAGGVFYNVKLNQTLREKCAKKLFSVMPLAGDQGAAIGMYAKDCDRQFEFGDLCWGKRKLYNAEKLVNNLNDKLPIKYIKFTTPDELEEIKQHIATLISNNNIVNLVIGNMEFGPRALCHTSTLFLPTSENVHCNNMMNGRNEVMPCAPVCTRENAYELFDTQSLEKTIGSDKYMICTHTYTKPFSSHYGGIMHKKPIEYSFTGRPQIVDVPEFMYDILKAVEEITDYKALVNTSFNVHGRPIAFDIISILQNYEYQYEHAGVDKKPYLIIIETE